MGQGKTTAIKYLSEILGYKLLVIQLFSAIKEEDLLGKVLKSKSDAKDKYLIVFNDLQNASDSVKEKIANISDRHQKNILLSDCNTIIKPILNIICIINTEKNSDIRNKLPSNLLYSTIYHKIDEMQEEEMEDVTNSIFI